MVSDDGSQRVFAGNSGNGESVVHHRLSQRNEKNIRTGANHSRHGRCDSSNSTHPPKDRPNFLPMPH